MALTAFVNATAILRDRLVLKAVVVCDKGRIVSIRSGARPPAKTFTIDVKGGYLSPGYIDLHVHGGGGADFMDASSEAVTTACQTHLKHGTTSIFPTTTTGAPEQIHAMLAACREADQPNVAGVHLYGPYFAANKVGCHSQAGRRDPISQEFDRYFETRQIRIATCAAELPGALEFYRAARRRRCLITCGHSNASWSEMEQAFQAGMRHVDHFWCAMSSVPSLRERFGTPMQASMAEFVLMNSEMSTEVIADGHHLAPELLQFAYQMLGPKRLCLVTDCNRALDQPPGRYRFGNQHDGTWFESDGFVGRSSTGSLASGIVGMDHMVRHFRNATTAPLEDVIRMASLTPAQRAGIDRRTGSIEVGKQADLLVLSPELEVQRVLIRGSEVHSE